MNRFDKYAERFQVTTPPLDARVDGSLKQVVVLPAYNEPNLYEALRSLSNCEPTEGLTEVIVVVNQPRGALLNDNEVALSDFASWKAELDQSWVRFELMNATSLPIRHAGVGMARKIGMDEAARRLCQVKAEDGAIICFDADARCSPNYLKSISSAFEKNTWLTACSIYFEHTEADQNGSYQSKAIYDYELYLRYYHWGLVYAKYPHYHYTIGSSMAVRCNAYLKHGGMNRRKAGEDFYFLHKLMPHGRFEYLTNCAVFPSGRMSERVPFGTGRAVKELTEHNKEQKGYALESFELLGLIVNRVAELYRETELHWPEPLKGFFNAIRWEHSLKRIKAHSTTGALFRKHFFQWFDGFMVLKLMHFLRDNHFPEEPIEQVASELADRMGFLRTSADKYLLECYRQQEKSPRNVGLV